VVRSLRKLLEVANLLRIARSTLKVRSGVAPDETHSFHSLDGMAKFNKVEVHLFGELTMQIGNSAAFLLNSGTNLVQIPIQ
jgi:hypothetical protein